FAAAALLAGRSDAAWIAHTRRFALLAWGLQSTGLLLGMWWAYHVLGWGGYWGWDPVENVALMPWLATTAYLHSSQVQERRGRLRGWNFGLVILAFLLVVFGTFIVRSGIVPSVPSRPGVPAVPGSRPPSRSWPRARSCPGGMPARLSFARFDGRRAHSR